MAFILFQDRKHPIEAQAKKLGPHHIEITGCAINASGFAYFQDAEMKHKYGDFNDFTTLYRELDESYILSDDGSVYPETSESTETPEPPLREIVESLKNKVADMQITSVENQNDVIQAKSEITDIQIAVCEIYEMIAGKENTQA